MDSEKNNESHNKNDHVQISTRRIFHCMKPNAQTKTRKNEPDILIFTNPQCTKCTLGVGSRFLLFREFLKIQAPIEIGYDLTFVSVLDEMDNPDKDHHILFYGNHLLCTRDSPQSLEFFGNES